MTTQLMWLSLVSLLLLLPAAPAFSRSSATPWTSNITFESLVYGVSTPYEVQQAIGNIPDEVVRVEQMYPLLENHYYYAPGEKGGAATVFVFENNVLVGMMYKTANNRFVDLTYFLPDNRDNRINLPIWGGYRGYFPGAYW